MSFLDKLGDFTGGFGEGLGETFLPAFQRGWDRQQELSDKADDRAYAEGIRADERLYNQQMSTINQLGQAGDLGGLQEFTQQPGLDTNLLDYANSVSGRVTQEIAEGAEADLRLADVALNTAGLLDNKNFLEYNQEGITSKDIRETVIALDEQVVKLNSILSDQDISEEDRSRITEKINQLDTSIQGYNELANDYNAWGNGLGESMRRLSSLAGTAQYMPYVDQLRVTGMLTEQAALNQADIGRRQYFDKLLTSGNLPEAKSFASRVPRESFLKEYMVDQLDLAEQGIETVRLESTVATLGSGNDLTGFTEILDFTDTDEGKNSLAPLERVKLRAELIANSEAVVKKQAANYMEGRRFAIQEVDKRLDTESGSIGQLTDPVNFHIYQTRIENVLRNASGYYDIQPWYFDREDWKKQFLNKDGYNDGLGKNYADFLNNSISFGAISPEDAAAQIENVQWMTVQERINARNALQLQQNEKVFVNPALRDFDLQQIQDGGIIDSEIEGSGQRVDQMKFTASDTEYVKQTIAQAMSGKGDLSVADAFKEVKAAIAGKHTTTSNPVHIGNALAAIIALEEQVMGYNPSKGLYEEDRRYDLEQPATSPELTTTDKNFKEWQGMAKNRKNITRDSFGMTQDYSRGVTSPRKNVRSVREGF
mgnify:CR=1 FL=1